MSEEDNTILKAKLKALYGACCDLFAISSPVVSNQAENNQSQSKAPLKNKNEQLKERSASLKYNGGWSDVAYLCSLATILPLGICTAFYADHFFVFLGLVVFGAICVTCGVFAYFRNKALIQRQLVDIDANARVEEEQEERKNRIEKVAKNYIKVRREKLLTGPDTYGFKTLQMAGVLALKDDKEIREACDLIASENEAHPFDERSIGVDLKGFFENARNEHQELGDWAGLFEFLLYSARSNPEAELPKINPLPK